VSILLSFDQFEREVIRERIRYKMAASRMKGIWMGGYVPLGHDVRDRKLVVNERDACSVRRIFDRFVEVGSATVLARELRREGFRSKQGTLIDKGYLYRLLNWSAPTEVVHQLGYDDPTFWRTRRWLESERSRKTLF